MSGGIIISDNATAKRLNELARHKMIVRLLDDIRIDLMICEIEGWSKLEYIEILTELINSFARTERRMKMLLDEFEKLTGFYPTERHYSAIEVAYMEFDGDKMEFCRKYKENEDGIAEKIQVEANLAAAADAKAAEENIKEKDLKIKRLEAQIKKLESRIRKMEGWEPYRVSHLTTEDYKLLRSSADLQESRASLNGDPERFGDSPDVYAWINDEFGFEQDKIQIVKEIPVYERSADGRIRKTGSHEERLPSYYSTDWNYVRFDAGPYQYEVVDGELYMYED